MKRTRLKKVILSISTFLFATCLGLGIGFTKSTADAETLTDKNNFSGLDTSLSETVDSVTIGGVADNYLLINQAIGNGSGSTSVLELEVELTVNGTLQGSTLFGVGESNLASTYAVANKVAGTNGFANTEYIVYYYDGTGYAFVPFDENGTSTRLFYSTVQEDFKGHVKFRYTITEWGGFNLELYVPSTNTQMSSAVTRDAWIALVDKSVEFNEPSSMIGWWAEYSYAQKQGAEVTGYPFMYLKTATIHSVAMKTNGASVFTDNFSNPATFATNYVTNDAFDAGVTAGTIVVPKGLVAVETQTTTGIATNHRNSSDMIRSVQAFKGAMRAELSLYSFGPTAIFGFYSLTAGTNIYMQTGIEGVRVVKGVKTLWGSYVDGGSSSWWTDIFKIVDDSPYNCMSGDFKLIVEINAQGDATFSLQVVRKELGPTALQETTYELQTINGLLADVVTGGGYLVFASQHSTWEHQSIIKGVTLTDAKGEVLIEDDFTCNNINGEGADLWLLSDRGGVYTLPGVNAVTFTGGVAYVNAQNTATAKEKLTIEWNAQVLSGSMKYYLGMSEKNVNTATAYLTVENGNLTFTQDTTETLATGVDFTNKTRVQLVFNNAHGKVYVYVNGTQTATAMVKADITGYMGISADNAKLTYLTADITNAFNAVDMQAGAYLKANTTLENSGIRFATIIDKEWYDTKKADENVASITYGTLIVPTDYLSALASFDLESLQASGKTYINAVVKNGFTNEDTATEDGYYQFMGGIKNILPKNYTRNFSAVGYVTVTYNTGAEAETVYTAYRTEDHSRNIYQLAGRTYGDRSQTETTEYKYQLSDGTWAKYSQDVMDVMRAYLDSVVNVTVDANGTVAYVKVNDYYTPSYQVTNDGNAFTVTSNREMTTVMVNGLKQKSVETTKVGDTYKATFTYAGIFDAKALFAVQTQVSEVTLTDLKTKYPNITAYTYKSVAYNNLAETQPFMAVGVPTTDEPEGGYPAIVLVHGGAGQVWLDWIKLWTEKGYVALALDMFANKLDNSLNKVVNPLAGPNENHSGSQIDDPNDYKNSWVYHSVTNVILCHNYLRSLPNVNANKIGITGISWGGFITNIVSGVDNRFSAFAPVYGAGYIYDDTTWNVTASDLDAWITRYDPSSYVIYNAKPTLYVSGINDNCFALNNRVKTYALAKGDVYYSQRSDLGHGYYWNETQEIYYFMEKILNGVADSVTGFVDTTVRFDHGTTAYMKINNWAEVKDKIASANVVYTTATDADTHTWTFTTSPVTFNENGEVAVDFSKFGLNVTAFNFEFVMNVPNYRLSTAIIMA